MNDLNDLKYLSDLNDRNDVSDQGVKTKVGGSPVGLIIARAKGHPISFFILRFCGFRVRDVHRHVYLTTRASLLARFSAPR